MNIYDIKKNTIMKKLKYVKLFESFVNEELSPELQQRAMDKGFDLANDPTRIDANIKRDQAINIAKNLSAATRALVIKLETGARDVFAKLKEKNENEIVMGNISDAKVKIIDEGLQSGKVWIELSYVNPGSKDKAYEEVYCLGIIVTKNGIEKDYGTEAGKIGYFLMEDRKFVKILEDLINEIQTNEIAVAKTPVSN
jgi:hypothetical protein